MNFWLLGYLRDKNNILFTVVLLARHLWPLESHMFKKKKNTYILHKSGRYSRNLCWMGTLKCNLVWVLLTFHGCIQRSQSTGGWQIQALYAEGSHLVSELVLKKLKCGSARSRTALVLYLWNVVVLYMAVESLWSRTFQERKSNFEVIAAFLCNVCCFSLLVQSVTIKTNEAVWFYILVYFGFVLIF